ncbi:hypothetical protein Scep_015707 [Stephania cephalantha]|uniref:Uncharacterized protein n=1 Tax=Stephania cephalantha TaxID=152367 RepID=A0AAP0J3G2_9MAGN
MHNKIASATTTYDAADIQDADAKQLKSTLKYEGFTVSGDHNEIMINLKQIMDNWLEFSVSLRFINYHSLSLNHSSLPLETLLWVFSSNCAFTTVSGISSFDPKMQRNRRGGESELPMFHWCFFTPAKLSSEDMALASSSATTPNEIQLVEPNKLKHNFKYDGRVESWKHGKDLTSLKQIMDLLDMIRKLFHPCKIQYWLRKWSLENALTYSSLAQ